MAAKVQVRFAAHTKAELDTEAKAIGLKSASLLRALAIKWLTDRRDDRRKS